MTQKRKFWSCWNGHYLNLQKDPEIKAPDLEEIPIGDGPVEIEATFDDYGGNLRRWLVKDPELFRQRDSGKLWMRWREFDDNGLRVAPVREMRTGFMSSIFPWKGPKP